MFFVRKKNSNRAYICIVHACYFLHASILGKINLSKAVRLIAIIELGRIQSRLGRSGDPVTADPAAVSVDRFADWTRSSATHRRVSRLTNGQTTSPSGRYVAKPILLANVSGINWNLTILVVTQEYCLIR